MKNIKLSMIAGLLGASTGLGHINSVLKVATSLSFQEAANVYSVNTDVKIPIVTSGFPKITEDSNDVSCKIFKAGFIHYNYSIITLFIMAVDLGQAKRMADLFHTQINASISSSYSANGEFKKHFTEEDVTPEEVVNISSTAEVVYSIFMGESDALT